MKATLLLGTILLMSLVMANDQGKSSSEDKGKSSPENTGKSSPESKAAESVSQISICFFQTAWFYLFIYSFFTIQK
ncbi:hypothetical protein NXF25_015255 [Crotalus adamanteus]|uniref:Uncharacterized protein n=1 Tax=Crotalus adamanteus TaxID=8729 RepID=A0AAW1AY74_CROAD